MLFGWPGITFSIILLLYNLGLVIYRLYFHPLSKFPGPTLNAATLWVDAWYDVVKSGQYTFRLKAYHEKYGPIVRINPNELHILDPEFYEDIYTSSSRPRDKYDWWNNMVGEMTGSAFAAGPFDLHRQRRALLNSYFSKKTIQTDALPIVRFKLDKLLKRLRRMSAGGEVVKLDAAFMALTLDIIYLYALDNETNYLEEDDFHAIWQDVNRSGFASGPLSRHFPWFTAVMNKIPVSVMLKMIPVLGHFLLRRDEIKADVKKIWYLDETKQVLRDANDMPRRSMIHTMRDAHHMPESERHPERVVDEAFILIGAGSETTARTLSVASWYLLTNLDVLQKLRNEVASVIAPGKELNDVPYSTLENLPYLSAVVAECLRLSFGVVSRLPRVIPSSSDEKLNYKGWNIPKGAAISMSGYYISIDSTIFPEPMRFWPERWLLPANSVDGNSSDLPKTNRKWTFNVTMNRFLVPFGKGSRACLGINLAYCEIYLALAMLAMHVLADGTDCAFELYETNFERDVKISHDFFTNFASSSTKGIRVLSRASTS